MQYVVSHYPQAAQIRLVQDNLNTHDASAFYENMEAQKAFELSQRFDFYYTPKSASWLNMVEIEFSALSRPCLNQRIATQNQLEEKLMQVIAYRDEKQIKINWQFTPQKAREKMAKHDQNMYPKK